MSNFFYPEGYCYNCGAPCEPQTECNECGAFNDEEADQDPEAELDFEYYDE